MERQDIPRATRRVIGLLAASQGVLFALLGWARYATFHNETFDLAFYVRIAWGLIRNEHWEPMVNAHIYGLHLTPILAPLGLVGGVTSTPFVLIAAQAAALALAAIPLSRIGARHFGPNGALLGAIAWLFYPNLAHVAGYEVHPGAMAALPLAWLAYALDRGSVRAFVGASIGVLLCREDLALVVLMVAALYAWRHRDARKVALRVGAATLIYALFFVLYLHPTHAPVQGSLQLHFGRLGGSLLEVAVHLLLHPVELLEHLAAPERVLYLPRVLAPLAFLPLLRPRWLLPALPILAINLISEWPTTTHLDVHYLTPALPFLVAGALESAAVAAERVPRFAVAAVLSIAMVAAHALLGGGPLSRDFPSAAFVSDRNTAAARAIVERVPGDASIQAPYALLPHFAERRLLYRASSPEAGAAFYVLSAGHRRLYAGNEDLLRTAEEPTVRDWMARDDHRLVLAEGDYLLLERGRHPREGLGGRAIVGRADPESGRSVAACLAVRGATLEDGVLTLELVARGPCPSDLALRIGVEDRPRRVDLLFGGWLSPVHLRRGDLARSRHRLGPALLEAIGARGLRIGAIRQSGARPEHADPNSIEVELR